METSRAVTGGILLKAKFVVKNVLNKSQTIKIKLEKAYVFQNTFQRILHMDAEKFNSLGLHYTKYHYFHRHHYY